MKHERIANTFHPRLTCAAADKVYDIGKWLVVKDRKGVVPRPLTTAEEAEVLRLWGATKPPMPPIPKQDGGKQDYGKRLYRLVPVRALGFLADVLTHGAQKYSPDNWRKVENARERYTDALYRHLEAWRGGETHDTDSGLHHLAHAACNVFFLLELDTEGKPYPPCSFDRLP